MKIHNSHITLVFVASFLESSEWLFPSRSEWADPADRSDFAEWSELLDRAEWLERDRLELGDWADWAAVPMKDEGTRARLRLTFVA